QDDRRHATRRSRPNSGPTTPAPPITRCPLPPKGCPLPEPGARSPGPGNASLATLRWQRFAGKGARARVPGAVPAGAGAGARARGREERRARCAALLAVALLHAAERLEEARERRRVPGLDPQATVALEL